MIAVNLQVSSGLEHLLQSGANHATRPVQGQGFRCEVSTGVWSHHTPITGNVDAKPKGYASGTGKKVRTHERPTRNCLAPPPYGGVFDPFDIDNTHLTPKADYIVPDPTGSGPWLIRCFENKFPVLRAQDEPSGTDEVYASFVDGLFPQVSAIGRHEVVVQHWRYNMCEALSTPEENQLLWMALHTRFVELSTIARFVNLLENHGPRSGGSLPHPHSQLLALPIIPGEQQRYYKLAYEFYEKNHQSVFTSIMERTLKHAASDRSDATSAAYDCTADRSVAQSVHFVALVPHAVERPHEVWVVPRRHGSSFATASVEEIQDLGLMMRKVLGSMCG
eukprot:COSAG02_NODE_291_length_25510_cov_9.433828_9_plen_334_part_00